MTESIDESEGAAPIAAANNGLGTCGSFVDVRGVNALSTRWHEGLEHVRDKDGLQNHGSLFVVGIRHLYHKIYGFGKSEKRRRTTKLSCW
jgi:hypothetical protein